MSDELSTRDDLQKDLNDITKPISDTANAVKNIIGEDIQNEIADRIARQVAEQAAKAAAETAAQEAAAAGAGGAAGAAATTAVAETAAGAGTAAAAGEAGAIAAQAGGTAAAVAAAEGAASGTIGGPLGAAIGAAVMTTAAALKNATTISTDENDPDAPKIGMITLAIFAFLFFLVFCGTILSKGISGVFSIGQETEFEQDIVKGKDMAAAGDQYKMGIDEHTLEYNYSKPLKNTINKYVFGTDGTGTTDGIRKTLDNAMRVSCKGIIETLDHRKPISGHEYDKMTSLRIFYDNTWPYDLATPERTPRIGDVLLPPEFEYEPWNPRYDDVNYAEVCAILSMSNHVEGSDYGFDWGNCNYNDWMTYLQKPECYDLMYELGLKWVPVYRGTKVVGTEEHEDGSTSDIIQTVVVTPFEYDSAEECREAPPSVEADGTTCYWEEYFVRSKVKPFGLRELFAMAFNTDDPVGASELMHVNFWDHKNIYMLDYAERVTRLYERDQKTEYKVDGEVVSTQDSLGPSFKKDRSKYSSIYYELLNDEWLKKRHQEGKGRSAWFYIEKTFNKDLKAIHFKEKDPSDPEESEEYDEKALPPDATIDPITGKIMYYPKPGEDLFNAREINTDKTYKVKRSTHDYFSKESSYYYTISAWPTLRRRLNVLDAGLINKDANEPLKYRTASGETYYVGAMIDGFAKPGDVIETKFASGESIKMIIVDVKSLHDATGSGSKSQIDCSYGHGSINASKTEINLCACEFFTGGHNSGNVSTASIPGTGSYALQSQIVGHINM